MRYAIQLYIPVYIYLRNDLNVFQSYMSITWVEAVYAFEFAKRIITKRKKKPKTKTTYIAPTKVIQE